ncbi:hypothetical protein PIB30_040034 [Stylosanthes scabra]|uniref:Uncharacterized protein n=1 Tax=Stylosanthes scabra TaxID=79078 RepID=A0ABU6SG48_9FABA|nr:hypothetical protein [Stylosanthes scabra]
MAALDQPRIHDIRQAGNLRFSPLSSYTKHDFYSFSLIPPTTMRPIAPRPARPAASPSSSASSGSSGSFHREREHSPHTPLPPLAPAPAPGPMHPIPRTPMTDARRYRRLFSRHRVAPPTPPPPSPPPSDDEPSVETIDPATELEGDPEEPYLADHIPIGAPRHTSSHRFVRQFFWQRFVWVWICYQRIG